MSARLCAFAGTPRQDRGGAVSAPSQVYLGGMLADSRKALDCSVSPIMVDSGSGVGSGSAAIAIDDLCPTAARDAKRLTSWRPSLRGRHVAKLPCGAGSRPGAHDGTRLRAERVGHPTSWTGYASRGYHTV